MYTNVGAVDRIVRVIVGILLIAYAIPIGFPAWVGIGLVGLA
ncbi:MAG: YgaP-like transmembrane domain [Terriglobales bacterium]